MALCQFVWVVCFGNISSAWVKFCWGTWVEDSMVVQVSSGLRRGVEAGRELFPPVLCHHINMIILVLTL